MPVHHFASAAAQFIVLVETCGGREPVHFISARKQKGRSQAPSISSKESSPAI